MCTTIRILQALLLVLVAVTAADKLPFASPPVAILRSAQVNPDEFGAHSSEFEAENGIVFQVAGSEGAAGGANAAGSWRWVLHQRKFYASSG